MDRVKEQRAPDEQRPRALGPMRAIGRGATPPPNVNRPASKPLNKQAFDSAWRLTCQPGAAAFPYAFLGFGRGREFLQNIINCQHRPARAGPQRRKRGFDIEIHKSKQRARRTHAARRRRSRRAGRRRRTEGNLDEQRIVADLCSCYVPRAISRTAGKWAPRFDDHGSGHADWAVDWSIPKAQPSTNAFPRLRGKVGWGLSAL